MAGTKKLTPVPDVPVEDLPEEGSGLDEFVPHDDNVSGLGDAATQAMSDVIEQGGAQTAFDGMENVTKVKFTGMAFDSIEDSIKLGDEVVFLVRARCTAETRETMKDGHIRDVRRMDVTSVVIHNG